MNTLKTEVERWQMSDDADERMIEYSGVSFCISDGHITGCYTSDGKYISRSDFSKELNKIAKEKTLHAKTFRERFTKLGGV